MRYSFAILFFSIAGITEAQVRQFPLFENFDTVTVPSLPSGWTTTTNRLATGDFTTTRSTPYSDSNAVISTNSTISQSLASPLLDFTNWVVDSLTYYERRSGTHTSGLLIEASLDSGMTYSIIISDTVTNPGTTSYVLRKFQLPSTLNNQPRVKIRWRVIGNGTGTTGTIRFDDILITARGQFDAGISSINFVPQFPIITDSVTIEASIRNFGIQPVQNISVEFFEDANNDSVPDPGEQFSSATVSQILQPGDSTIVQAMLYNLPFGEKTIIIRSVLAGDQNSFNDVKFDTVRTGLPPHSLVINEIMYYPTSPEPEWIEVASNSVDSVNLKSWSISDRNTRTRYKVTSSDVWIHRNDYIVLTKDSSNFVDRHPDAIRVLFLPSLPTSLLNNDSDAVVLFDHRGAIMDSVFYHSSWGGTNGKSLERLEPDRPSNDNANWGTSFHPDSSTPGKKNSLTQKDFDVSLKEITFSPSAPYAGNDLDIHALLLNRGKQSANDLFVEFYEDLNGDSLAQANELFDSVSIRPPLPAGDSITLTSFRSSLTFGDHLFFVRAVYTADEDTSNNTKRASVLAGYEPGTVVINEIMYAPPPTGEPEWVEFYNTSSSTIELKNWKLSNRNSALKYSITTTSFQLSPNGYCVITKDTALFNAIHPSIPSPVIQASMLPTFLLNNSGDAVVLFDSRSARMDSVRYSSTWGGTGGKSLERIEALPPSNDSTNWGTSADSSGSTPGKQNYLTPLDFDLRASSVSGISFSQNSSTIAVVVRNVGRQVASSFPLSLFHDTNGDSIPQPSELLETQIPNLMLIPKDSAVLSFTWSNPGFGRKLLIATVDFTQDMRTSDNIAFGVIKISYQPNSLIINEIMYEPRSGQAEYVELLNRSSETIDLREWKLFDIRDTTTISTRDVISQLSLVIGPEEFVVIATDSSLYQSFPTLHDSSFHVAIMSRSNLSLNNNGDDIVLTDLTGKTIDSVHYFPNWHNAEVEDVRGRALERINPNLSSNDRRNWSTCADPLGGTPGKQNSLYTVTVPSEATISFSPNPFSPDGDGFEDVTILSYSLPTTTALIRVRIYDAKGRLIRTLADGEPAGSRGELIWDGFTDKREISSMGIYVVLLEALDANGGGVQTVKGVVVVAAKM
ncbi:MAG: lamin tail domain-containing protein [Ignavibacteriae bacterium]|nr:lamin tail domain-containing protein [Ignavibacteriota bacterium]